MVLSIASLLSACSVTRMLPKSPVIDDERRRAIWNGEGPSGADYQGKPKTDSPILPFMVFGVTYDLDIVLVSKHPEWNMHEYARIQTPDGPIWIAKDARESTGDQLLVADIDDIYDWLPEIPLKRKHTPLEVTDEGEGNRLDLTFRYENHDGEQVVAQFEGPAPHSKQSRRNGSTMGHSRDQVMAVLDLPLRDFGKDASVEIGGQDHRIDRVLGLKPLQLALQQTQGGIAEGTYRLAEPDDPSTPVTVGDESFPAEFQTVHDMPGGPRTTMNWTTEKGADALLVRSESELRTLGYRFRVTEGGALELTDAWVRAWNATDDTFHIEFAPALPDLRYRFDGEVRSRFVMDINGQRNHAVGSITTRWTDEGPVLETRADKPWWVEDRCGTTRVDFEQHGAPRIATDIRPCD